MQIQICFVGSIYLWEYVRLEKSPVEEISFGEVSVAEVSVEDLFLEKYQSENCPTITENRNICLQVLYRVRQNFVKFTGKNIR